LVAPKWPPSSHGILSDLDAGTLRQRGDIAMEIAMAQVIVRHLEDETVQRLKERARRKGHSLERELREILAAAARQDMAEFKARAAAIRALRGQAPDRQRAAPARRS
jgi:antitoxin FitA